MDELPKEPKLFYCAGCEVYFFSFSGLEKPTHSRCKSHKTRLANDEEICEIKKANKHLCGE